MIFHRMSLYKSRGSPFYPSTCARAVRAAPAATLSRAKGGTRGTRRAEQRQDQRCKEQEGEAGSPGKTLAGRSLRSPGKSLAGATCPTTAERATLEPKGSNAINHIGTKAREAPPWWHAGLRKDHRHTRSDEDQKTMILGKILAEEIHETSGKILAGDDRGLARTRQDSTAVPMQLPAQPAKRAPVWRRVASRPAQPCVVACRSS